MSIKKYVYMSYILGLLVGRSVNVTTGDNCVVYLYIH